MSAAAKIATALSRYGRAMTLRRRTGTGATFADVTVNAVTAGYRPGELTGGIAQGDEKATISNSEIAAASWPGPPRKGDLLVVDGKTWTLQGCATKYLGPAVLAHDLWIRG